MMETYPRSRGRKKSTKFVIS